MRLIYEPRTIQNIWWNTDLAL